MDLGKITGYDLLRGPSGFDLALGDGCGDCCCLCLGASNPYSSAPLFSCVSADYGAYTTKTTATFTITGTPVLLPFLSGGCGGSVICTGTPFPDPTGTWAFALSGAARSVAYRNYQLICETGSAYYSIQACIVFSIIGFACDTASTIAQWAYVTRGVITAKPFAPVLTSGWEEFSTFCSTGGGEGSTGNIQFKMPTDCCATVWQYALGPHAGGNCQESCNFTQCFPKCFTNALVKSTTHTNSGVCNAGVDYSGLSVALAYT